MPHTRNHQPSRGPVFDAFILPQASLCSWQKQNPPHGWRGGLLSLLAPTFIQSCLLPMSTGNCSCFNKFILVVKPENTNIIIISIFFPFLKFTYSRKGNSCRFNCKCRLFKTWIILEDIKAVSSTQMFSAQYHKYLLSNQLTLRHSGKFKDKSQMVSSPPPRNGKTAVQRQTVIYVLIKIAWFSEIASGDLGESEYG